MRSTVGSREGISRIIVHTPEPTDGAALYVCELSKALAETGVPVILFCPPNFAYSAEVARAGVSIVHSAARTVGNAGLVARIIRNLKFVLQAAWLQYRLVRRDDIVHFQFLMHLPLGFLFLWLVIARRGRIVLTAHDPLPHKWRMPEPLRSLERKMLGGSYRLTDHIIVHNETGRDVLIREFREQPERISIVPHGPLAPTPHKAVFPKLDHLRLLIFGSIRENKGIYFAIQAVQLVNSVSNIPVQLTIAGRVHNASEEAYWERCKALIGESPDCIELLERFIPDQEVTPLIAGHHALLLPYCDFFSESGVAAVALSNWRPIIATRAGGMGQLLAECNCGIPIESPTVDGIAEAITAALRIAPDGLMQMGINGHGYLNESRSWPAIARQTIASYLRESEKTIGPSIHVGLQGVE